MAIEQLKQIEGNINVKDFKPQQTADFSLLKFVFNGSEVESSANKASTSTEDFIQSITNLSNKLTEITSAGLTGDDLSSAISEIKPKLDEEADLMMSNKQDFQQFVTRRLNNMSDAERAAYKTTQNAALAGKIAGEVSSHVGDALDETGKQIIAMSDEAMSFGQKLMEDASDVAKTILTQVGKVGATAAAFTGGVVEGVVNVGEMVVDTAAVVGGVAGTLFTGAKDLGLGIASLFTGEEYESSTANLWKNVGGFVSKDYSTSWADSFWNDTKAGNVIKDSAYGFDAARTAGKITGEIAATTIGAGAVAGVAGGITSSGVTAAAGTYKNVGGVVSHIAYDATAKTGISAVKAVGTNAVAGSINAINNVGAIAGAGREIAINAGKAAVDVGINAVKNGASVISNLGKTAATTAVSTGVNFVNPGTAVALNNTAVGFVGSAASSAASSAATINPGFAAGALGAATVTSGIIDGFNQSNNN